MHDNSNLNLYNLQTRQKRSINTRPGTCLEDIAVTKDGDLVYIDYNDCSVNIVKNTHIESVIKLREWIPRGVCSTFSGDLLVVVQSADDDKQSKVLRYSGSEEKQSIQFNDKKAPPYSSGCDNKYITENKNKDICVSNWGSRALVMVNRTGKFRFVYTGPSCVTRYTRRLSAIAQSFYPYGITTDSHNRILIADLNNHRIHILDLFGQFLRYIEICDLQTPRGLCVDTEDNLFVADENTNEVKKIQYCMLTNRDNTSVCV